MSDESSPLSVLLAQIIPSNTKSSGHRVLVVVQNHFSHGLLAHRFAMTPMVEMGGFRWTPASHGRLA